MNKQKVCAKTRNTPKFQTDNIGFSKKLQNPYMDSSQTKQKGVDPNSINPSFFAFRNIPNNVYIQRKLTSWRICWCKNFLIYDAFFIQNDLKVKIWIFAKMADQNWIICRIRKTPYECERFFSEGGLDMLIAPTILFCRYLAKKSKFWKFCWCMLEKNFQKSIVFDFLKIVLNHV